MGKHGGAVSSARKNLPSRYRMALSERARHLLSNRRWRILVLAIFLVIALTVAGHLVFYRLGEQAHILLDVILLMILTPLGLLTVSSLIEASLVERDRIAHANSLNLEFSQKLGSAASWDELVRRIVEYVHQVAPPASVTLFTYNPASLQMDPEAACKPDGVIVLKPPPSINPDTLPVGSLPQLLRQTGGDHIPRSSIGAAPPPLPPNRFDLPITRSDQVLGVIKLEFPLGSAPTPAHVRALQAAEPVIALALEVAMLQKVAVEQAAASAAQRQQIAQNLHDTLAQNISYLRLKLDQFSGTNAIHEIGSVLQELERMRATADEAYQQVRSTLDELGPIQGEDLPSLIMKQARAISNRAGFALHTSQVGAPYNLPASARQQILYIVREALHNVEKHSHASQVNLQHIWLEKEFMLKINDNGIGFNPRSVSDEAGHYGLWIMQRRAREMGGTIKIVPMDGEGTEVTLWVPRPGSEP